MASRLLEIVGRFPEVEPLAEHRVRRERRYLGAQCRLVLAHGGNEQATPGWATIGEDEHQASVQVTRQAAEHRLHEQGFLREQRLDQTAVAVAAHTIGVAGTSEGILQVSHGW